MKIISWNVNGFRSVLNKGFKDFFEEIDADIFCLQETKMQIGQAAIDYEDYLEYYNSAEKKGYSGTAVFTKVKPLNVTYDLGIEEMDKEGRVITVEYDKFYLVNCYTPNSKRELERLEYRCRWEDEILKYLQRLDKIKPVIYCGDLNVAHKEIDLKNPSTNHHNAGFTDEEREKMTCLLNSGFVDSFRYIYPNQRDKYTWWSYIRNARYTNAGWRIDYVIVSDRIKDNIKEANIYSDIYGSDHCPVGIEIDI